MTDDLYDKVLKSAIVMTIDPGEKWDTKVACELGMAILLDKPIVIVSEDGKVTPPGLLRSADMIIKISQPLKTEAGRREFEEQFSKIDIEALVRDHA